VKKIRGTKILLGAAALAVAGAFHGAAGEAERYDLVIRNARIVDGSGGAWYRGDIGIRGGRIARIGRLHAAATAKLLDAGGRVAAPGFLDVHVHVEEDLPARPDAANLLSDGVTTVVTGNCGSSEPSLSGWFARLTKSGTAIHVASLVGHNTVRRAVMGGENRAPTAAELSRMRSLVRKAMEEGAVGLSTGLIYAPGSFASPEEVIALAKEAAASGGLYATHMRSEGEKIFDAIDESIAAAKAAGLPLEISHYKVTARPLWGSSGRMLERLEKARAAGIDVTADWYPYAATSAGLDVLLPDWALAAGPEGSRRALRRRLARPKERGKIAEEMFDRFHRALGRDHLDYAIFASAPSNPSLVGKSVREANRLRIAAGAKGLTDDLRSEIETVLDTCSRGESTRAWSGACGAQMVYHVLDEADVERIFASPFTMVASDGGVPEPGGERPHPRSYGTRARVLARYVRERGLLQLEEAVRKMTSLPAERFGFQDRGLLREGLVADVVLFDPETVEDRATFEDPYQLSRGFDDVVVAGVLVREGGRPTGARPGRILLGPAARTSASAASSTADREPGPSGAASPTTRR